MTAIDTNVAILLERGSAEDAQRVARALALAAGSGRIVISGPAFSELCAGPDADAPDVEATLTGAQIVIDCDISIAVWKHAGNAFRDHVERQKASGAGAVRRIAADFIIGAHACTIGSFVTTDAAFFRRAFPDLRVIDPREFG